MHRSVLLLKPLCALRAASTYRGLDVAMAVTALGIALSVGFVPTAQAEGVQPAVSGQTIGLTCVVCHGAQGKGTKTIPPLAGRNADQTYNALIAYKTGARPATVMDRHAKGYSDEELRAVAEYFASLPTK